MGGALNCRSQDTLIFCVPQNHVLVGRKHYFLANTCIAGTRWRTIQSEIAWGGDGIANTLNERLI